MVAHLAVYRRRQAIAHLGVGWQAATCQSGVETGGESLYGGTLLAPVALHTRLYARILARLTEPERQVLQLRLDMIQTQTVGQWSVEELRFAGNLQLLVGPLRLKRAHIVQPVGQLYQQRAHVGVYALEQLPEIVNLLALVVIGFRTFGYHIHQGGYFGAEAAGDVGQRVRRILHHIVQQGGGHHPGILLQVHTHNAGHRQRMQNIRFARLAALQAVGAAGKLVSLMHQTHPLSVEPLLKLCIQLIAALFYQFVVIHTSAMLQENTIKRKVSTIPLKKQNSCR